MSMLQEKQLGQARPSGTSAVSLYSPAANVTGIVKTIYICNTSSSAETFRIFADDDGTDYDESTALFWEASISANSTVEVNSFITLNNQNGNLAVRSSASNALTFTAFGAEVTA